jgi:hypothetical protein
MNRTARTAVQVMVALSFAHVGSSLAQDYAIDWHTIDGGGETWSTGGDYELGGTIGQPDANELVMTGGDYSVTGGFWALPPCWCLSDINNDGLRNGDDIQNFVDCLVSTGYNCACADVVTDGILDMADVGTFVSGLLAGGTCP